MLSLIILNCSKYFGRNLCYFSDHLYEKAVDTLNKLQSNRRNTRLQTVQDANNKLLIFNIFLEKSHININEIERKLSIIHVSGTKGKGSSCAFCESILRNCGYKTGFFSSPHLISVRERIRVNGQPVSREQFTHYFWYLYENLNNMKIENNVTDIPSYFMLMNIMAYKVFEEEKVDVAIIETGIGGEYDCTNVLKNTGVVGISSLGYDHQSILGNTLEEIAWQKAGIMKPGAIAIIAPNQPITTLDVIQRRAIEKKCSVYYAPHLKEYFQNYNTCNLGIKGPAQSINASLALQLANAWMNPECYRNLSGENFKLKKAPLFDVSKNMLVGLEKCFWPGRTQILNYSSTLTYYIDGAHNKESMQYCVSWFQKNINSSCQSKKILMFYATSDRNLLTLLQLLLPCQFDYVLFCPNIVNSQNSDILSDNDKAEVYQRNENNFRTWFEINNLADNNNTKLCPNIMSAISFVQQISSYSEVHVLITGSLYLVGSCLSVFDPKLNCNAQSYKT